MKTKLLSIFLSILLLTSFFTPVVAADRLEDIKLGGPEIAVFAIPEVTKIIADSAIAVMSGIAALEIAENLGIKWDHIEDGWNQLMKDTGATLDKLSEEKKWIDATSLEAEAILRFDYYTAPSGSGGKKNDKLYHKAKLKNGKVKINTERISEEEAAKELKEGRDIFTAVKDIAKKISK